MEIPRKPEMIRKRGRNQSAYKVAADIAGDIGSECATRVLRAAFFAEVSQRRLKSGPPNSPSSCWLARERLLRNGQKIPDLMHLHGDIRTVSERIGRCYISLDRCF